MEALGQSPLFRSVFSLHNGSGIVFYQIITVPTGLIIYSHTTKSGLFFHTATVPLYTLY
jgi:hypothetical protein